MSAMIGKCSSCGADLKWDFGMEPKFCPNCGAKLSLDEGAPSSGETGGSSYGDGSYSGQSYEDGSYSGQPYEDSSYSGQPHEDGSYSGQSYEDSSYAEGTYKESSYQEDGSYNAGNSYGDGSYNAGSSYGDNTYGTEGSYGNNSYGTEGSYGDGSYGAGPDSYDQTQDLQGDIGKRAEALAAEVAAGSTAAYAASGIGAEEFPSEADTSVGSFDSAAPDNSYEPAVSDSSYEPAVSDSSYEPAISDSSYEPAVSGSSYEPGAQDSSFGPAEPVSSFNSAASDETVETAAPFEPAVPAEAAVTAAAAVSAAAAISAEAAAPAEPAASAAAEPVPGTEEAPPHHTHTTAAKLSHYLGLAGITTAGTTDPGVYLNRLSATFLALLKLLEGIAGGIAFFFTAIALFPLIKGMISSGQQVISVDRLIEEYVRAFVPASINVDKYLESVKTGLNIPMLAVGIAAVLILVPLALIIVDAIASVFLRFFRTGAGTIKVIHLLCFVANLILFIVLLASFVLTMIGFFSLKLPIPEQVKEIGSALPPAAAYGIVFGITAAVILLLMCYHKDVAQAMKVVSHDIDTGARADMNYTRLPVICIILALISLVSIVGAGFSGMYSSGLPVGGLALIVLLAFSPLFGFVKYLLVAVCYMNLMKAE